MKNKHKFDCDVDGSILVMSALRYALSRHTYVPASVQDWIRKYWNDLDRNTQAHVVWNTFEHLYSVRVIFNLTEHQCDYDSWKRFGIEMYHQLDYQNRKWVDDKCRDDWYKNNIDVWEKQTV